MSYQGSVDLSLAFHTWGCLWDKDPATGVTYFTFSLDGAPYGTITQSQWTHINGGSAGSPFDQPFFLLLNHSIGGDWALAPVDAIDGQVLEVDYVRVYAPPSAGGAAGSATWPAVLGTHNITAWVDNTAVIPESDNANNTTTEQIVVSSATPPGSTVVTTLTAFQNALNAGNLDITLTAAIVAPAGGINIPRIATGRTVRCSGAGIVTRGARNGPVIYSSGSGGRLTLSGFRVDGGWRTYLLEDLNVCQNYYLNNFNYIRIENCVSCYGLSVGFDVAGSSIAEIVGNTMFACPRDHCWARGCNDLLVDGNLIQHCGDDSMGTHIEIGAALPVRSQIFRNNTIRDAFGGKVHGGSADGTINGKVGQVRYENNLIEAGGLYGVHGEGDNAVENDKPPRNIFIISNTFKDIRRNTPPSGSQQLGYGLRIHWPGFDFVNVHIEGNAFVRTPTLQGQTLQSAASAAFYPWGRLNDPTKPQNVPGAGAFQGFFNKTGFAPTAVFDLATVGVIIDGNNPAAVVHSGNTFTGSGWTNTIT